MAVAVAVAVDIGLGMEVGPGVSICPSRSRSRHTDYTRHMDVNATMAQPSDGKSELRVEEREQTGNGH